MGASIYTYDWAEAAFAKMREGQPPSDWDKHAMMLVYREVARNAIEKLRTHALAYRSSADWLDADANETPEVVRRDSKWLTREDSESDEKPL